MALNLGVVPPLFDVIRSIPIMHDNMKHTIPKIVDHCCQPHGSVLFSNIIGNASGCQQFDVGAGVGAGALIKVI